MRVVGAMLRTSGAPWSGGGNSTVRINCFAAYELNKTHVRKCTHMSGHHNVRASNICAFQLSKSGKF